MRFFSGSGSETLQFYLLFCKVTVDEDLLASLLPGPVTLVFTRTDLLNRNFNPDTNLIGVRIPDHLFIRLVDQHSVSLSALHFGRNYLIRRQVAVFDTEILTSNLTFPL